MTTDMLKKLVGRTFIYNASNTVSTRAFREVRDLICGRHNLGYHQVEPHMNDIGMDWLEAPEGCPVKGSWTKRLSNYLYKQGISLTDEDKAEIGEIAKRGLTTGTYFGRIVDQIDWRPGTFGDGGSCYWGGRSSARSIITSNGGGAILWYKDSKFSIGASRVLVLPRPRSGLVLFNAYGSLSIEAIADAVAAELGTYPPRRIKVTEDGTSTGIIWINGERGMLIPMTKTEPNIHSINFKLKRPHSCDVCGNAAVGRYRGRWLCRDCTPVKHTCKHCQNDFYETMSYMPTDVCRSCISTLYFGCESCNNLELISERMVISARRGRINLCRECHTTFADWKQQVQPRRFVKATTARNWLRVQPPIVRDVFLHYPNYTINVTLMEFINRWMEDIPGEVIVEEVKGFNVGDRIIYTGEETRNFQDQIGTLVGWKELDGSQPYLTQWNRGGWNPSSNGGGLRRLIEGTAPESNSPYSFWWCNDDEFRLATAEEIARYEAESVRRVTIGSLVIHTENWGVGTVIQHVGMRWLVQFPRGGWTARGRADLQEYNLDPDGHYWWCAYGDLRLATEEELEGADNG